MCLVFMHRDLSDTYLKVYVPVLDMEPYFQYSPVTNPMINTRPTKKTKPETPSDS